FQIVQDPEYQYVYDEVELAFVDALQRAAARWNVEAVDSWVWRPFDEPSLIAVVTLVDRGRSEVATLGVHLFNGRVRGGLLHNLLYELLDGETRCALDISGTVEDLAAECAVWFERLLRKPIVRHE